MSGVRTTKGVAVFLYIDATAGGLLIQVLLGGFAGIGFVGRLFWSRLSGRSTDHVDDDQALPSDATDAEPTDRAA